MDRTVSTVSAQGKHETLSIDRDKGVEFLGSLKKRGQGAWVRLQLARAIDSYQSVVWQHKPIDLSDIIQKLTELAGKERQSGTYGRSNSGAGDSAAMPGLLDPSEPEIIQQFRREIRMRHYSIGTESAYVGWAMRFLRVYGVSQIQALGEPQIKEYLSSLAVDRNVSASTQNQAFSALLFLFRVVLKRELGFLDAVRAKNSDRLPVVLSRGEVQRLMEQLGGRDLLMAQLLYGAGLRLMECLRLRVKDIEFDTGQILVREGKGRKDRVTVLPAHAVDALRLQVDVSRELHQRDLAEGYGQVWLPDALAEKYPNAPREFAWQFVFPATKRAKDPRSGTWRRHVRTRIRELIALGVPRRQAIRHGRSRKGPWHMAKTIASGVGMTNA
ncbi:MAG: integron integrase [Pirellulaceae bacterium]|nr:integron integrase [Pirellulaceae bacterium]